MNSENPKDDASIVSLIQDVKNGLMTFDMINEYERKVIVHTLRLEGYTILSISQLLKCSYKSIQRIAKEVKKDNQITPSSEFAKDTIGEMYQAAMQHWSSLVRLARSSSSSTREKIEAEFAAWRVLKELVEKLQSTGCLPQKPTEIVGDLYHHLDGPDLEKSLEEARNSLNEVIDVAAQCGNLTPELKKKVSLLQEKIVKVEIVQESEKIKQQASERTEAENDKEY